MAVRNSAPDIAEQISGARLTYLFDETTMHIKTARFSFVDLLAANVHASAPMLQSARGERYRQPLRGGFADNQLIEISTDNSVAEAAGTLSPYETGHRLTQIKFCRY